MSTFLSRIFSCIQMTPLLSSRELARSVLRILRISRESEGQMGLVQKRSAASILVAVIIIAGASLRVAGTHLSDLSSLRGAWELVSAGVEILIGALLITNSSSPRIHKLACGLVLVFLVVTGARTVGGDADCGCFGVVRVP